MFSASFNVHWIKRSIIVLLVVMLCISGIYISVIFALDKSLAVSIHHLDGAYQTASGLNRLAKDQLPGREFFPYLGAGILLFLYPLFKLMGGTVGASMFTAELAVALAFGFSIGTVVALLLRKYRLVSAVAIGSMSLCAALYFIDDLPPWIFSRLTPGNSLRPFRAFIPYLAAAILLPLLSYPRIQPFIRALLVASVAGIASTWSTDYGLPTAGSFGLFALGLAYAEGVRSPLRLLGVVLAGISSAALTYTVMTGLHPFALLKYIFLDVGHDQYWYFPAWYREARVFTVDDFFVRWFNPFIGNWAIVLVLNLALAAILRSPSLFLLSAIGFSTFLGGALTVIGGHVEGGYAEAFTAWCKFTAFLSPLLLLNYAWRPLVFRIVRLAGGAGIAAGAGLAVVACSISTSAFVEKARSFAGSPALFYSDVLGGYVPVAWKSHVELALSNKNTSFVEDYWGIWSSISNAGGRYPTDSVIHALGSTREKFAAVFEKEQPELVVTSNAAINNFWLGWQLSVNWWFYGPLLSGYSASDTSPTTLVWRKNDAAAPWPPVACRIMMDNGNALIDVGAQEPGFFEVDLSYDASNLARRSLLFVQNNLNFVVYEDGFMPIDTAGTRAVFPVSIHDVHRNKMKFKLVSEGDDVRNLSVKGCSARRIVAADNRFLPPLQPDFSGEAVRLTDGNWVEGVARYWAGFFINNTPEAKRIFAKNALVLFEDGTTRLVLRAEENGPYLNVYLSGAPLALTPGEARKFDVRWMLYGTDPAASP